jgi:hypothetical protein
MPSRDSLQSQFRAALEASAISANEALERLSQSSRQREPSSRVAGPSIAGRMIRRVGPSGWIRVRWPTRSSKPWRASIESAANGPEFSLLTLTAHRRSSVNCEAGAMWLVPRSAHGGRLFRQIRLQAYPAESLLCRVESPPLSSGYPFLGSSRICSKSGRER